MKKQFLFLAMITLAFLFAGTMKSYGQLLPGITTTNPIDPLSCVGTSLPLHPYPGTPYTYTMNGTSGDEDVDQWTWFATKNPAFISGGTLNTAGALAVGATSPILAATNYNTPSATNSVTITWSPEILAATEYQADATGWATASSTNRTPTFVVGYGTGVNCADNIQVYEINPLFNFTIDIAAINEAGTTLDWDVAAEECVDFVQGATYNSTSNQLDMDYGLDTVYFEVAAANFVNDFTPTFRLISGLLTTQTATVSLHNSLADAQNNVNATATTNWTAASVGSDWTTPVAYDATNATDVVGGVSLYVRVVIDNNTYESLTDNPFVLAVDAIDDGGTGQWDMENDDCPATPATATDAADQYDQANQIINPRPTIIMDGAAMSEPSGVTPEDIIIKTP